MIKEIEQIKYHIEITGQGKPLICLHGFAENYSTWNQLHLEGYKLYKIDFIGHGNSEKPEEQSYYTLSIMLSHLHELILDVVGSSYSILGYSMGGRIGTIYALNYEKEIKALLLESSSFGIEKDNDRAKRYEKDRILAENILKNGIQWFQEYWSGQEIFETQKDLPDSVKREIKKRRLQNKENALANTLLGSGQGIFPYCGKRLEKVSFPVLYICGNMDKKYAQIGETAQGQYKNFLFRSVLNAGHNVHLEQPETYCRIVQEFLDKNE